MRAIALALLLASCSTPVERHAARSPVVASHSAATVNVYPYPYTPPARCESVMFPSDENTPCTHSEHRQIVAYDESGFWAVCICKERE